jgi:uncharacterized membrane protein YgaE (UPF0421/DUF939 family)
MWKTLRQLRGNLAASPNRIAFAWALRGTIATGLPLVALPALGLGPLSNFVVIGALNTSMVDVGGSYRSRLTAMALNVGLSPLALLLGSFARDNGWIAATLMFIVAFASGHIRALGPAGVSLGLTVGLMFLVGIGVHHHGGSALEWAALYIAGGLWTILLALVFWHFRPYRRLEQEVAAVWEETATLVATARAFVGLRPSVVRRRRQERLIAKRHQALRDAVEKALSSLGYVRGQISGPGVTMAQFLILLRAASRIGAAAVTLSELPVQAEDGPERVDDVRTRRLAAAEELEAACRGVAATLLAGRGKVSLGPMQAKITDLISLLGEMAGEVLAYAQAMRHLESAGEALDILYGGGAHPRVHIGVRRPWPLADTFEALRAHFSFRSAIFRHALRVGLATAAGTAVAHLQLAHGIWVPMATLIVLQPEFGGTIDRAIQRTAGTVAGAALAGVLLATLNATAVLEPLLIMLLFAAFFVLRRRYGLGVTFLTPLVVLILATADTSPWWDTFERIVDTILGAGIGLGAGYLLWPQWERERLPRLAARALRTNRAYMAGVLKGLCDAEAPPNLGQLRRTAEIETGNAEAAFQRLLTEPRKHRGRMAQAFAIVTYLQRLERHLIALAEQISTVSPPKEAIAALGRLLEDAQEAIATAIETDQSPSPCHSFDEVLTHLRAALTAADEHGHGEEVAFLLGRLVSDTASLHSATTRKAARIGAQ